MTVRKTDTVRRGLRQVISTVSARLIDDDEGERIKGRDRADLEAALKWLREQARAPSRESATLVNPKGGPRR